MKKLTTIILTILCVATLFAQAPEKFTYQAVVRNANNSLVANAQVGMRVSVLQGSASGSAVYVETHTATTNANGLVTLSIGGGSVQQGTFSSIDWANGPFFLQTETDPNGGSNYTLSSTQQLLSVPYALYAKKAENGFSGDYNDLTNKPQNVSAFTNDAGYINAAQVPEQVNADWNATTGPAEILNKPAIPTVPASVSAFTNDAEYITTVQLSSLLSTLNNRIDSLQTMLNILAPGVDLLSCPEAPSLTDVDGNLYRTIKIGNQCWTRENLRTTHFSDGMAIPEGVETYSFTDPYYYDYTSSNIPLSVRGYLYNWAAVMRGAFSNSSAPNRVQGICPTGWHFPSDVEWAVLKDYVSSRSEYFCGNDSSRIAKALASTEWWNSSNVNCAVGNNPSTNNASGFGAVPAGLDAIGLWGTGSDACFWSYTVSADYSVDVYVPHLTYTSPVVDANADNSVFGLSVRCLRNDASTTVTNPSVSTNSATNVMETSATLSGIIINPDNVILSAQGFEWKAADGGDYTQVAASGTTMIYELTGLTANTSYTYRAFVTYGETTAYGAEVTFTTLEQNPVVDNWSCPEAITVTDVDGNVYNTVQIGNQCWMRENLRTTHYSDSTAIPFSSGSYSDTAPYYYDFSSSSIPLSERGYFYNWPAMMHGASSSNAVPSGVQGVCPIGWHVPSDDEWSVLINYLKTQTEYVCGSNTNSIAKALASTSWWNNDNGNCTVGNNLSTNNASGLNVIPAGGCWLGVFGYTGEVVDYWSSTLYYTDHACYRGMYHNRQDVAWGYYDTSGAFPVRCLRN